MRADPKLVALPYFCGHFLFPLVVIVVMVYLAISSQFESIPSHGSANPITPWDDSKDPFFVLMVADLHHCQAFPERDYIVLTRLGNITRKFNPPLLVIAGDLVEGANDTIKISWRREFLANWERYNGTRWLAAIYSENRTVFENAGNHDLYSVAYDNLDNDFYRRYVLPPNATFGVRCFSLTSPRYSVPVNYILFNPQRPPTASGPPGIFPLSELKDLEALEQCIADDAINIISAHWPTTFMWSISTTATGQGVHDLFGRNYLYMCGHTHPSNVVIERRGDTVVSIVSALYEEPWAVLGFADSGGAGAQVISSTDDGPVLVTYPLPKSQLTNRSVFNLHSFPIRAISFTETAVYLVAYIDNVYLGTMNWKRTLRRNVQFYTLNVSNVPSGTHKLRVGTYEMEFFVGEESEPTTESQNLLYSPIYCILGPAAFFLHSLMYVLPWWDAMTEQLDNYRNVLFGKPTSTPLTWYQMLILGPLYNISRLRRVTTTWMTWFAAMALIFVIVPLYSAPVPVLDPEGNPKEWMFGYVWVWGMHLNGDWSVDAMNPVVYLVYSVFFMFEMFLIVGILYENDPGQRLACGQILEIVVLFLLAAVGFIGGGLLSWHAGAIWTVATGTITWVELLTLIRVFTEICKGQKARGEVFDE
jgi:metallophosphoesterase superfamily enzyme